jgi:F0F1-type ATP synthase membrane subunit b/b'
MRKRSFLAAAALAGALFVSPFSPFSPLPGVRAALAQSPGHEVHPAAGAAPTAGAHARPAAEHAPAESAEHGGEAAEEHGPKPINWTDFSNKTQPPWAYMFLNFVILVGIYYKYGKAPIASGLKNRRATVAREIEEAQRMQKEAEARAAVYQAKLQHLEAELKDTRDSLTAAGEGERDRIVREAEEKAARMEKEALFLVEQEMKQLRLELTRDAIEAAVGAAEELLKKRITASDQERLAEDYLAQLAAKRPSGHERVSIAPGAPQGGE